MTEWFIYLLKSTVVFILLYVPFLWMKKDTLHKRNRFYLLSIVVLSFLIPAFQFTTGTHAQAGTVSIMLDTISVTPQIISHELKQWSLFQTISVFTLLISTGLLLFRMYQMMTIYIRIKKHKQNSTATIIQVPGEKICYSVMGYIFISPDMQSTPALQHEFVHVNQKHAIDLFIYNLFVCLHWFNPFSWFALRSLKAQHEYEADKTIIQSTGNKNEYQALLLSSALGCDVHALTHSFSSPTLKNRFIMMTKKQSSKWVSLKTLMIIPLLAVAVVAFSMQTNRTDYHESEKRSAVKEAIVETNPTEIIITQPVKPASAELLPSTGTQPLVTELPPVTTGISTSENTAPADEMTQPEFPGGNEAFVKYMQENIKYPEKLEAEGKVYVSFVVKEDGSITEVIVKRGFNDACDKEAVRVISGMPRWKPAMKNGKAAVATLTIPIAFKAK